MATEKRRSGIAFQIDQAFPYMGHMIPQEDLYKMACSANVAQLVKMQLAYQWLKQRGMLPTAQQHNTQQRTTTHHAPTK
jgi:hypothetical protein